MPPIPWERRRTAAALLAAQNGYYPPPPQLRPQQSIDRIVLADAARTSTYLPPLGRHSKMMPDLLALATQPPLPPDVPIQQPAAVTLTPLLVRELQHQSLFAAAAGFNNDPALLPFAPRRQPPPAPAQEFFPSLNASAFPHCFATTVGSPGERSISTALVPDSVALSSLATGPTQKAHTHERNQQSGTLSLSAATVPPADIRNNPTVGNPCVSSPKQQQQVKCSHQDRWDDMIERLKQYKAEYGDCRVPKHYNHDRKLGFWVITQRHTRKTGKLSKGRIQQLDSIGFVWSLLALPNISSDANHMQQRLVVRSFQDRWDQMFERLKQYKAKHGDSRVPKHYDHDRTLGNWVNTQRTTRNARKLSKDRIQQLDSIGFAWVI